MIISTATIFALSALFITMLIVLVYFLIFFLLMYALGKIIAILFRPIFNLIKPWN